MIGTFMKPFRVIIKMDIPRLWLRGTFEYEADGVETSQNIPIREYCRD